MFHRTTLLTALIFLAGANIFFAAENRAEKVRADRAEVTAAGRWIYNDLNQGFAEARRTGRPLLVVLRCVP